MIANISPALCHYEETHNTLKYAARTKKIKQSAIRNSVNVQFHIGQYTQLIENLQTEVKDLRDKLAMKSHPTETAWPLFKNFINDYTKQLVEESQNEELNSKLNQCKLPLFYEESLWMEWLFDFVRKLSSAAKDDEEILNLRIQSILNLHKQFSGSSESSKISKRPLEDASQPTTVKEKKGKSSRRVSMLPKFDSSGTNRRQSFIPTRRLSRMLPVPAIFPITSEGADAEKENFDIAESPRPSKLVEDLKAIDFFLDSETPKARKPENDFSNSRTPKAKQPVLRTLEELRDFANHSVKSSPQVVSAPFSPAQKRLLRRRK